LENLPQQGQSLIAVDQNRQKNLKQTVLKQEDNTPCNLLIDIFVMVPKCKQNIFG